MNLTICRCGMPLQGRIYVCPRCGSHIEDYHNDIEKTLPWRFSGAAESSDGLYAIGVIYSEKLGCPIVSIGHDGIDMRENVMKVNAAANFIVECCNGTNQISERLK